MDFVAIDFETANASPTSACELGLAVVRNYKVVESHSWLIRPPDMYFNVHHTRIHGITANDMEGVPTFDLLWTDVQDYFKEDLIVAHNAEFDINVLRNLLHHYQLSHGDYTYTCSIKLARRAFNGMLSYGLKNLSRELGIHLEHHKAESDATACAMIASKAFQTYKVTGTHELPLLMNVTPGNIKTIPQPRVRFKQRRERWRDYRL
jgi:DNA polymerase III subunit epsilon